MTVQTTEEAVRSLRAVASNDQLISEAYLDADPLMAAARYDESHEPALIQSIVGPKLRGSRVLDVGAGNGMVSRSLALRGAYVTALEPDPSDEIGFGAIRKVAVAMQVATVSAFAEALPFAKESFDVVFGRQVLHHFRGLERGVAEMARVLRRDGLLVICREHVADDERELAAFLANHPVHALTGGENAFPLKRYLTALESAGLEVLSIMDPWSSVLNAYPAVRSEEELRLYARQQLQQRYGGLGRLLGRVGLVERAAWARIRRPTPGRLYSFVARPRVSG